MTWLLSVVVALSAALPPQAREQITIGTGSILGKVIDERTGLPIGGVVVRISGTTRPPEPEVRTTADGQFLFSRIAEGRYSIATARAGYFDGQYGRRSPLGAGSTFVLGDGERIAGLDIALVKPAAVTGTIRDDAGDPVVKVEVRAYVREYLGGRPHYSFIGGDLTDDRGVYRVGLLPSGDFLLGVPVTRPRGIDEEPSDQAHAAMPRDGGAVSQLPADGNGNTQVFPAAYFPAGVAAPFATAVHLEFGEVRRNIDFAVRPAPAFRLAGSMQLPAGAKRSARVRLTTIDEDQFDGGEIASIAINDAGTFAIGGIPPGQYILKVETTDAWAQEIVSITDADILDIRLLPRAPLQISGRITFDGSQPDPAPDVIRYLELALERADGRPITIKPAFTIDRAARSFTFTGLMPGRYLIRAAREMQGWFLGSVMHQGRDVSRTAFDLTAGDASGLTATFGGRTSSVAGTVTGAGERAAVFLFPQDQQLWVDFGTGHRTLFAVEATNGEFEFRDVPAGDYIAVAVIADPSAPWRAPTFLQPASRVGTAVRVTPGTTARVDLRVVTLR